MRSRIVDLVALITVAGPSPSNLILRWDMAIQEKLTFDHSTHPSTEERQTAMHQALITNGAAFSLEVDELEIQCIRLQSLGTQMDYIWTSEPQAAIRKAQSQNPLHRLLPAALRELARLNAKDSAAAGAARNVAKRWLDLLGFHIDLQDPMRSVHRAQRRLNPHTRRSDLLTEVRSMLQNEAGRRQQLAQTPHAAAAQGLNLTVEQIREAIRAMASEPYRQVDEIFLMNHFTDERIQTALDLRLSEDELDQGLIEVEQGLYRTMGV